MKGIIIIALVGLITIICISIDVASICRKLEALKEETEKITLELREIQSYIRKKREI